MKNILIIGGCGYIGSALYSVLLTKSNYSIDTCDLEWYTNKINPLNIKKDYRDLTKEELAKYDVVVLLAGHSSVPMAENSVQFSAFHNNVSNFMILASKLKEGQKFIYISSSSVYNGIESDNVTEDATLKESITTYDKTKRAIDDFSVNQLYSKVEFYSLRLATVCGFSPNQRVDTMINMMVDTALNTGEIFLLNGKNRRPLLYMNDLLGTIQLIIELDKDHRGIYNLSSLNATIEEVAEAVANETSSKITLADESKFSSIIGGKPMKLDFSISSEKIQATLGVKIDSTVHAMVTHITKNTKNIQHKSSRATGKDYK